MSEDTRVRDRLSLRRVAGLIGILLLVAIVVPFIVYAIPQVVGAEQSYVVLSASMSPTIGAGDVILVDSVEPGAINEGDIITFAQAGDDRPTTHRVIDVMQGENQIQFQTKGDANEDPDSEPVAAAQLQGRVMSIGGAPIVFPEMGRVILFTDTPIGFTGLFVIPVLLFVAFEIRDIIVDASTEGAEDDDSGDTTAAPTAATDGGETGDGDESGLTFRAIELRLGIIVLGLFTAYGAWVAYVTQEIWSVAALGMVGTTFVLLLGLFLTGGESADTSEEGSGPSDPDDGQPVSDGPAETSTSSPGDGPTRDESVSGSEESGLDTTASPATGPTTGADREADTSRGESDD